MWQTIITTLVIHSVTLLTPGLDVALVLNSATGHSRRQALENALGIVIGTCLMVIVAVVLFLTATSVSIGSLIFIKLVGIIFLLYLAYDSWRSIRGVQKVKTKKKPAKSLISSHPVVVGIMAGITNPETSILFIAVFSAVATERGDIGHILVASLLIILGTAGYYFGLALLGSLSRFEAHRQKISWWMSRVSLVVYLVSAVFLVVSVLIIILS